MTKFKIGQTVKVINVHNVFSGQFGKIVTIGSKPKLGYGINFEEGQYVPYFFKESELQLVSPKKEKNFILCQNCNKETLATIDGLCTKCRSKLKKKETKQVKIEDLIQEIESLETDIDNVHYVQGFEDALNQVVKLIESHNKGGTK